MEITYQENGKERLDKYLLTKLDISRNQIKKAILARQILVNQKPSSVHHWLKNNDLISYQPELSHPMVDNFILEPTIINNGEEFLILEKPHGLLVHPTDKGETNTLADWLVKYFPITAKIGDNPQRPAIVHRLDREVSGLMVIPLTEDSFTNLKKQFQDRTIQKEYTALLHGQLINNQGEITTPLERDKKTGLMRAQVAKQAGRPAHTTYEIIKRFINYTLVKVKIKTGRMHQIRAHFYSIGHSIVGDKLYRTKDIRKKKKILEQRIFLHANFLKFKDLSGHWREYSSSLPQELQNFLAKLK